MQIYKAQPLSGSKTHPPSVIGRLKRPRVRRRCHIRPGSSTPGKRTGSCRSTWTGSTRCPGIWTGGTRSPSIRTGSTRCPGIRLGGWFGSGSWPGSGGSDVISRLERHLVGEVGDYLHRDG